VSEAGAPAWASCIGAAALLGASLLAGCEREARPFQTPPSPARGVGATQIGSLRVGPAAAPPSSAQPASAAASSNAAAEAQAKNPLEENAWSVAQGKRLYRWYNCNGCHANGGGDKGPPLMDARWIYGGAPAQIVATILEGRPNGMPSFAGRIPEDQVWQIAAYVRSMSGQLRTDVAPSRSDALTPGPPETRRDRLPIETSPPGAAQK
jgi:cytochrome c oxidase cbb3-type subunit 3